MGFFNRVSAAEHQRVKDELDEAKFDLDAATAARQRLEHNATLDRGVIETLTGRINDLEAEIARLKPLAEATERRRANDAKRVRPSRAKKAATDTVKTGAATGKPRAAIPAKVGGGSAKLSGDRPAKKAVR